VGLLRVARLRGEIDMKRVAITGISGHLGNKLLQRLDQEEEVERVVGIDCRPPTHQCAKLQFYSHDITEPFDDILIDNEVDSAIHLAFILVPGHDTEKARRVNIVGTKYFLKACQEAPVQWLLFLSSNTAYGAFPDNAVPLTEDLPLRVPSTWTYAWHKVQCEQMFQDFGAKQPDKRVAILRSCPVLGPKGVGTGIKEMFTPVVMVRPIGHDAPWQFLHEDDAVEIFLALLRQKPEGTFNMGGDGTVKYSEITSALGRWGLPLPASLLKAGLILSWKLHLQSKSSPDGLEFLKYPVVLSNSKVQETTGYRIRHSSREALDQYLES
jgi:UDP-glucose 4-epimerase